VPGPQLAAPLAFAPTRLGRLLSPFFALRWRKTRSGLLAATAPHGAQYTFLLGRQFLHVKMIMLKGKHINLYLLDLILDFVAKEVEYQREDRTRRSGAETPKRR
jgi:hypothetical protein